MDSRLFLPGWGAPAALYAPALPASRDVLDPRGGHMWMLADGSLLATAVSE
jgi:hypothetical protein